MDPQKIHPWQIQQLHPSGSNFPGQVFRHAANVFVIAKFLQFQELSETILNTIKGMD